MELFQRESNKNLLPRDGEVRYYGQVFPVQESTRSYELLLEEIEWQPDVAFIFGKRIETKRKVAWYGDQAFSYTYSNHTKTALPWTPELLKLKKQIEDISGETFNSCLLNLYHDGSEGMAWHSDGEEDLKKHGAIASVSFGAERKFAFKHMSTKETVSLVLQHGSLLIMAGVTQTFWLHRLPPTKKAHSPRVNLTFRTIEK
ncbi:alpha-ketoglutarate-dependent dioxygenase AlkB family protein [Marinoscillum pacificum]|uniref:alpha-ketoglutarate-dependent dioxygenase AlkB family protein n=1 Tax=Marinoscillum pacificum TaxID=392723 RepID=UPI002157F497|nr:alpha-ketoglutarate-dependent dioxygenase AlkB [Marinoscillum pacificum]